MNLIETYHCSGCGAAAETITCYQLTDGNEYAWRKRVGVKHKEGCIVYRFISETYPQLVKRIEEERNYGKIDALAS